MSYDLFPHPDIFPEATSNSGRPYIRRPAYSSGRSFNRGSAPLNADTADMMAQYHRPSLEDQTERRNRLPKTVKDLHAIIHKTTDKQ
ncbi:hypothetical protein HOA92_05665 [archaeon]|nr:hypothetical protein [archaeon]